MSKGHQPSVKGRKLQMTPVSREGPLVLSFGDYAYTLLVRCWVKCVIKTLTWVESRDQLGNSAYTLQGSFSLRKGRRCHTSHLSLLFWFLVTYCDSLLQNNFAIFWDYTIIASLLLPFPTSKFSMFLSPLRSFKLVTSNSLIQKFWFIGFRFF